MSDPLLSVERLSVAFGGNPALREVDLDVTAGSISGLIGPNGAGKTTLFNVITGLQRPSGGRVRLDCRDISRLSPYQRARLGIGRTFQRLELFTELSVRDNLRVAGEIRNRWRLLGLGGRSGRVDPVADSDRLLDLLDLRAVADRSAGEIPTGTARVVELGRALMSRPRIVLLDEPASGQTEDETEGFGALLRQLVQEDGLTVLLVEHDMALVMDVCTRLHVLDFGRIIAAGAPAAVRNDPAVLDAYLGTPGA